jgi:hypothetical protein
MRPSENPILPPQYDGFWTAFVLLVTFLMIWALFDVMRSPKATMLKAIEWVALIVVVPVVGPMIWFLYGRNRFN